MQEIVLLTDVAFVLFSPFMFFICYSPILQDDKHIPRPTHSDEGLTLKTSALQLFMEANLCNLSTQLIINYQFTLLYSPTQYHITTPTLIMHHSM